MSAVEVYADPAALAVSVDDQCAAIEQWAEQCDSVPELRDAINKCAAIDEYLARTSSEGRARVAAAMRRIEVRIGALLPPPMTRHEAGVARHDPSARHRDPVLTEIDRHTLGDFRSMAENPEVVETVIAESTDDQPASRRKVMQRIKGKPKPTANEKPPRNVPGAERAEQIRDLAEQAYTSVQIGDALSVSPHRVREVARKFDIPIPADAVVGKQRNVDANRVVAEIVYGLEGSVLSLGMVEMDDLDRAQCAEWATSLSNSLRSLNRLSKQLKEMAL